MYNRDELNSYYAQIAELRSKLNKSDYKVLKYFEGELDAYEYSTVKDNRRQWRAEINALEAKVAEIKSRMA